VQREKRSFSSLQVLTFHDFHGGVLIVGKILVSARLTCLLKLLTCRVDVFYHIVKKEEEEK
jgi:hypothetical protein